MLIAGETFPFVPVTDEQKSVVIANCGGVPIDDLERLRNYLAVSGYPMVDTFPFRDLVQHSRRKAVHALGLCSATSEVSFNRGAYFYAGMLNDIGGINALPLEVEVARDAAHMIADAPLDFALEAYQRGRDLVPFRQVFDLVCPVLIGEDENELQSALLGAGTLDYIVSESLIRATSTDRLEDNYPELSGLFDNFEM